MGINARKSLHPYWVNHHTRTIDGFKNCVVSITRNNPASEPVYNPATKTYTNTSTEVYSGPARIQPYGINFDVEVGNDPTARRLVLVQIKGKELGIRNDDTLKVVSSENNEDDLTNYEFDIRGSIGSSLQWGTNLVTEVNLKGV